ncbi:2-oxo acid dehydrogenase subunit E2 [Phragmitibacter flavus]|uniref:Dihydrolipoamide acetyltransferase component of pyruvate dehydrogenase complex n=1 Tax=Phragmitibacter flavus TaxID=2576071 RepID=A0A5R8KBC2_9BACT|nr:2-oxo acid dehydrogenase subunit E2 [Phragmitibacter flavus]TLD69613.1 2-oxo acid dehydrogenase subunit E2 [Phragmitibacter flavus]
MPAIPILMPQLGESIAEAMIIRVIIEPGSSIKEGDEIFEVETNKAVMTVTAPCDGEVGDITAQVNTSYAVGARLGSLNVSDANAKSFGSQAPRDQEPVHSESTASVSEAGQSNSNGSGSGNGNGSAGSSASGEPANLHFKISDEETIRERQPTVEPVVGGLPVPAGATGAHYISSRMRARMHELGLNSSDLSAVAGSGAGGRVTVEDLELFLRKLDQHRMTNASPMRIAVADSMRRSWSRPLATVGMPIIIDAMLAHRKKANPKPGPALYAIRALALALSEDTAVAGRLVGSRIVHPNSIDIGFAVEVADGVLVPTIREVDKKPLSVLVEAYNKLVDQARARRLPNDANRPGIATVTNFGSFGIVWATPIPLPEQNLVLGLGAGRKAPVWSDQVGTFIPVTEANMTLSFDHRILDGGAAGRLLQRVAQLLQQPEKL